MSKPNTNSLHLPGTKIDDISKQPTLEMILRGHSRVLILGDAGIGEDYFERFSMLQLIDRPAKVRFLPYGGRYVPLFVPLKVIDNSKPHPIYRYIVKNVNYFSGSRGQRRLRDLALKGRLLICLDGYDEIALAAGETNFVRDEISSTLSVPTYNAAQRGDLPLAGCRIWLSSRKEFFHHQPYRRI